MFFVAGSIAGATLFLSIAVTVVLLATQEGLPAPPEIRFFDYSHESGGDEDDGFFAMDVERPEDNDEGNFFRPPARTNFLMVGLDNNLLADAIMVGTFYRDNGDIHLMSVPRDMFIRLPNHRLEQMQSMGLRPPHTMKINELRAFGGREHGIYYLQSQISEMLGVDFNFFIEVELAAFRRIVDAIGGVKMYIPHHFFYEDPTQNPPLRIDIPEGMQLLDGYMAEGFVRFRSFPTGDLQRNNMQMEFMSELIKQTLTRDAIMNDPLALGQIILNDVRSNVGLDLVRFIPYIGSVSGDSISTFTMPGEGAYIGGISYFVPDTSKLPEVISKVFYHVPEIDNE